jgi:hypothetical protein
MNILNENILNSYGKTEYIGINELSKNNKILNFTNYNNTYYKDVCNKIINDIDVDFNYNLLQKSIYLSTINNHKEVTEFIFKLFFDLATKKKNIIKKLYDNNKLKLSCINNIYKDYNKTADFLKFNVFSYYNKSIIISKEENLFNKFTNSKHSYFNLIKNLAFNNIVIENKYNNNEHLYNLVINSIKKYFYTIEDIIDILNMYLFFNKLKYSSNNISPGVIENKYLLNDILGEDINYIQKVNKYINNKIINISKNKNIEDEFDFQSINEIRLLYNNIKDKNIFYLYYYKLLSQRIIKNNINFKIEMYISRQITDFSNITFRKIYMMVHDLMNNIRENKNYKRIQYTIENNYDDIKDFSLIKLSKVKIINLNKYAWKGLFKKIEDIIKLPSEIQIYKKIYNEYYDIQFTSRKLYFLLNESTVELTSVINNKEYTFLLNIPQCTVLMLFNKYKLLSTEEIVSKTNINNLKYLEYIINSFLSIKLIYRNTGNRDELKDKEYLKNIKFYINNEFENKDNYISLLNLSLSSKNSNISKEDKLKIYNTIIKSNSISTIKLYDIIKKDIQIKIEDLESLLNDFKKVGMINNNDNQWVLNDSDSDTSSSD